MTTTPIYLNGFPKLSASLKYKSFVFTGGEVSVKFNEQDCADGSAIIYARCNNSDDIMKLLLANDALRRLGYEKIELFLPYIPHPYFCSKRLFRFEQK